MNGAAAHTAAAQRAALRHRIHTYCLLRRLAVTVPRSAGPHRAVTHREVNRTFNLCHIDFHFSSTLAIDDDDAKYDGGGTMMAIMTNDRKRLPQLSTGDTAK